MSKRDLCFFGITILVSMLMIDCASASNLATGLPWEAPMDKVVRSITGPVAKASGVVALTATGLAWAFGIGNDMVQKGAKVGTALSIAFNATSHLLPLLGFAQGLLI